MAVRVGTLRINLAVDLNAFQKGLRQAERSLDKVADRFESIGSKLTKNVTAPLLAVGGAAAKMGADFDHSLSRIQGLLGATTAEMAQYRAGVLALAGPVAKAPQELATALTTVVDAGFKGREALDVLRVAAKASTAGLGDTTQIADAVTVAMKVYAKENLSAAQAAGVLIAAGREGRASLEEMMPVLGAVGPVASELGVKFNEVNGAIAAMSDRGMSATESGTALRALFTTLLKPSTDAQKALADMGLSADGLRRQIQEKGLLSVLQTLQTGFQGNEAALARVFPGAKALGGILTLLGTEGGKAQEVFKTLASSGVADLNTAFAAAESTAKVRFEAALARLQVVAIQMGDVLMQVVLPALNGLSAILQSATEKLNGMTQGQKNLVLVLGVVAAAAGPAALLLGQFFKTLSGGLSILRSAIGLFISLGGVISGPVLLAAAALAVAGVMIINRWREIADGTKVIVQFIYEQIRDSLVGRVVEALGRMVGWIAEKLKPLGLVLWDTTVGTFQVVAGEVSSAALTLSTAVGGAFDSVVAKAGAMATGLLANLNVAVPQIKMQAEIAAASIAAIGTAAQDTSTALDVAFRNMLQRWDDGSKSAKSALTSLRGSMRDTGAAMQSSMVQMGNQSLQSMGAMTAAFARGSGSIGQFVSQMVAEIGKLIAKILLLKALTAVSLGGPFAAGFIGGAFADGGRPPVGKVSVVGEEGPELFVPDTAGSIIPNDKLGGMGGGQKIQVVQNVKVEGMDLDSDEAADRITRRMLAMMRDGETEQVKLAVAIANQGAKNSRRSV